MKPISRIQTALSFSLLSMVVAPSATAQQKSELPSVGEVRNGGQIINIDGRPMLRDLVSKTTCSWTRFDEELAKAKVYPKILESLSSIHWYLAESVRSAERGIESICWVNGPLLPITLLEDMDAVTPYERQSKQVAIRINQQLYISRPLFNAMDDVNRSYLFFHEISHALLPSNVSQRSMKLRSFVYAVNQQVRNPGSAEAFSLQLKNNDVDIVPESRWLDLVRDSLTAWLRDASPLEQDRKLAIQIRNNNLSSYLRRIHAGWINDILSKEDVGISNAILSNDEQSIRDALSLGYVVTQKQVGEAVSAGSKGIIRLLLSSPEVHVFFDEQGIAGPATFLGLLLSKNRRDEANALVLMNRPDYPMWLETIGTVGIHNEFDAAMEYAASKGEAPLKKLLSISAVHEALKSVTCRERLHKGYSDCDTPLTRSIRYKNSVATRILLQDPAVDPNLSTPVYRKGYESHGPEHLFAPVFVAAQVSNREAIKLLSDTPSFIPDTFMSTDMCFREREDHEAPCWAETMGAAHYYVILDDFDRSRDDSGPTPEVLEQILRIKGRKADLRAKADFGLLIKKGDTPAMVVARQRSNEPTLLKVLVDRGESVTFAWSLFVGKSSGGSSADLIEVLMKGRGFTPKLLTTLYSVEGGWGSTGERQSALGVAIASERVGLVRKMFEYSGVTPNSPARQYTKEYPALTALQYAKDRNTGSTKTNATEDVVDFLEDKASECKGTKFLFWCF